MPKKEFHLSFKHKNFFSATCECGCQQEFHCRIDRTPAKFTAGGLLINVGQLGTFLNKAQEQLFLREDAGNA